MAPNSISSFIIASLIIAFSSIGVGLAKADALFVFGDSYADTGNHDPSEPPSFLNPWKVPYGSTWPGKPTGRYSDGRVFTDFYALVLGVRNPVPYRVINITRHKHTHAGVNFAFGGSGVFPTYAPQYVTFGDQINQLQDLVRRGLVSKKLIKRSTALMVVSGNDYFAYQLQHSNAEGINEFILKVVTELEVLLNVLHNMGFRRIVTANMEPLGCVPGLSNNFTTCSLTANAWSSLHNSLLASHISSLQSKHPSTDFGILDFQAAFHTVITDNESSLRPCCFGIGGRDCGDVDENGGPLYTVCSFPSHAVFWDRAHPTSAGWKAISKALFST